MTMVTRSPDDSDRTDMPPGTAPAHTVSDPPRHDPVVDIESAEIVEAFMALYNEGRIADACEAHLALDAIYRLHIDETAAPFGGATVGRGPILAVLTELHEEFDYVLFATRTMAAADGVVRQRLEYILRHRDTNVRLDGIGRFVWTVRDGMIVACDEYQDAAKLEAFFQLFSQRKPKSG
jgi:ketosteroid isomerase-like protein